jgi:5'-nucleotidase
LKILLTNDDGVEAKGLLDLYNVLHEEHDVYVIAPDGERSACSNAISIRNSINVKKHSIKNWYSLSGYPGDCVSVGINSELIGHIDCVISGINHGLNVGDDIHFSGTVAGARTAFIFNTSSIAVSLNSFHKPSEYFTDAAQFVMKFISSPVVKGHDRFFYNINFPDRPAEEYSSVEYTKIGHRKYKDYYSIENISNEEMMLHMEGIPMEEDNVSSDVTVVQSGGVSITPLTIDATDYSTLESLERREPVYGQEKYR